MEDRVLHYRVGVLVVATFIIAILLLMLFGEVPSLVRRQYTVYVRFPQAPGVTVDTPVKKSGILIGRVRKVTLLDDGAVVVTAEIDAERVLRSNEVCRISSGNILGDAELEFVPSAKGIATAELYQDGDYLDGLVSKDPLSVMDTATTALQMLVNLEGDFRETLDAIEDAGQRVGGTAESLSAVVSNNSAQLQRILSKSEQAMDRFDFAMSAIDSIMRDENLRQQIEETISQIPDLITDASDVMASFKEAADEISKVVGQSGDFGDRIDRIFSSVDKATGRIDEVFDTVDEFAGRAGDLFDRLDDFTAGAGDLFVEVDDVLDRANENLENLKGITGPFGERGENLAIRIESSVGQIDDLLGNLVKFSESLNNPDGTIGQLLNNRELYDRVNSTVDRVDYIASEIAPMLSQLRPIIKDTRILTDKLSRDPRQLGLRGVLDRRQSQLKY